MVGRYLKIVLFISSFSILGLAQDSFVELEVSNSTIEKGESVSITIKYSGDGKLLYDFPDEFKQRGGVLSGMSSNVKVVNGKSTVEKFTFEKITGSFRKAGNYKIGPVKLQTSSGEVESNSVTVKVEKALNMISANPADNLDQAIFGIIQQSKKEVYIGEPIIVEAKVYAQIDVLQIENYDPFNFEGPAEKIDLKLNREATRNYEEISGRQVMTFSLGRTIFYPELNGNYEISPFEMIVLYDNQRKLFPERARIRSNESKVKVKPLPSNAPQSFNGAVGKFELSASIDKSNIEQGKVMALTIELNGVGDIDNLSLPKPILPEGALFYGDPEKSDSVFISSVGVEGRKKVTHYIQMNNAGEKYIPAFKFTFFNPESEKYETIDSKPLKITVDPSDDVAELLTSETESEEVEEQIERRAFIPEKKNVKQANDKWFEGWKSSSLFIPILTSLIFGLVVKVKEKENNKELQDDLKKSNLIQAFEALNKLENEKEKFSNDKFLIKVKSILDDTLVRYYRISKPLLTRDFIKNKIQSDLLSSQDKEFLIELNDKTDSFNYGAELMDIDHKKILDKSHAIIQKINDNFKS